MKDSARKMKLAEGVAKRADLLRGNAPQQLSKRKKQLALLEEKQKDLIDREGDTLQRRNLVDAQHALQDRRYFHGMVTFMSKPLDRHYFILDSKRGHFYTYKSLCQA